MTERPAAAQARGAGRGGDAGLASGPEVAGSGGLRGEAVTYGPINKLSAPSDLRITDLRSVIVAANFDYPIIRMDTNQGVYGLGEVRDGGFKGFALGLKPLLVGRNPLDITSILDSIRPYAGHGRQGGGYSAIDICLHDINGKVFGVPVWRLLGDKKRSRVRLYCDTNGTSDPKRYAERMLERKKLGFTFFKMDITTNWLNVKPGCLNEYGVPTERGLAHGGELISAVKDAIGWEAPLGADLANVMVTKSVKDAIRVCRAWEKYELAFAEELFGSANFMNWRGFQEIRAATTCKLMAGENAFGLVEGFKDLIDNHALDIIHPDPGTSGGCRETKRIADYAFEHGIRPTGIPTMVHMAGSPVASLAAAHMACTLNNFMAQECHAVDFLSWWQQLVAGGPQPFVDKGYIRVPDAPGLGIELNEPVVKEHLREPGYFEPTPEYDKVRFLGRGTGGPWPHFNVDGVWVNERTSDY
jgi:L-alanine-DL-glutamate epimerase-like enolase superfamily enzyme